MTSSAPQLSPVAKPLRSGPLAGVRVLDLTRLLPGPMCTSYLVDLGADVIKIEDTGPGDYARALGAPGEVATFFRAINRNKRSLAVDLKQEAGRAAFMALARVADIIVESFRPGVVRTLGVAYEQVTSINPRIVYASISGYGQDGPRAAAAGHDINYLGYAGVLEQTGTRDGAPALSNLQTADLLGGAAMPAVAILAALYDAQRSGCGRYIDVAMADAVLAHNVFPLQALADHGTTVPRGQDMLTGGLPCYGVYATQDGRHLAVGALEQKFWHRLCVTLSREDLIPHGRATGTQGERVRNTLADIFAAAPLAHWAERLRGIDCCVTPVNTLSEALEDPQFTARGMVSRDANSRPQFAPPFRLSGCVPAPAGNAPAQGEHSVEVLQEAGYDAAAIAALLARGVIRAGALS